MNDANTRNHAVKILSHDVYLDGIVSIPTQVKGFVIFVHGSGSSRNSPRNQYVAQILQDGGFATLLFDLLTPKEERIDQQTHHLRFDINLLVRRTRSALDWLTKQTYARELGIGLFGASTGAAAALITAAEHPGIINAVVSRGGRPDLAGPFLSKVQAATLLIVGGYDKVVIDLNKDALAQMQAGAKKKLMIVPGATHLFDEPGTLDYAAQLARDWFQAHLNPVRVG